MSLRLEFHPLVHRDIDTAFLENYPQLTREDIPACIAYGAETARERYVAIPMETRP